jgi:uncharacterized OB-fold protein
MLSPVKIWRNQKKIASLIGKYGTVISYTYIRVPPADFAHMAPYPVAIIALDDHEGNITVQLVECQNSEIKTGLRVKTVLRRLTLASGDGVIPYGIKAVPVE